MRSTSCVASLYDLKITAPGYSCINIDRASLNEMVRCELVALGSSAALYMKGGSSAPSSVGKIDACQISSKTTYAIQVANSKDSITMISNSNITSEGSCAITNANTITFGGGNTVVATNQLVDKGKVIFTEVSGSYRVGNESTLPVLGTSCTVTPPIGYAIREESVQRGKAATHGTLVYNIVVQKAGCVQKFERCRRIVCTFVDTAGYAFCRKKHKHRTHHFAVRAAHMRQCTVEKRNIAAEKRSIILLKSGKFNLDWLQYCGKTHILYVDIFLQK
jgi:hypothetical protein